MPQNWFEKPDHTELLASREWAECEDRIRAFEKAWRQAPAPDIDSYVGAAGPARLALLTELAHLDLEFRFTAGQPARVETYLERYPELSADRYAAMELIEAEHGLRQRGQQDMGWEDYRKRFPKYVDELIERENQVLARTPIKGPATAAAPEWPAVFGYEIVGEIARGGMGVVYKAFEPSLGRYVALKFLPTEVVHDPERLERFLHEARTASALNHPHICTVHALGKHGERPFIVLEFIEGETLRAHVTCRPGVEKASQWIAQAAQALSAAHAAGVVHRDVKPENIMVRGDGYVKVLDFGLARRHPLLPQPGAGHLDDTDPGTFLGTVAYMSPEQAFGATATSASDIFSLGLVLYQLVTGQHPFHVDSALGMLQAIATTQPAPPSRLCPEIPATVDGLIEAMLRKDPRLRPSAAEVHRLLLAFATAATRSTASPPQHRFIVHRERELAALHSALQRAEAGRGEVVCVVGEPGIGKSALVQDFLESAATRHCFIARGRCSERLGSAEAYMPVMDGLQDLLRTQTSASVGHLIKVMAPAWYFQLAHLVGEGLPAPDSSEMSRASSQPALLREFRALVEEISRLAPVIVFLDDVHWADVATVDLLAYLGRHCQGLRLLLIVTYRPTELLLGPHPFHGVKLELQSHGTCSELALDFLRREDIARYLTLAFPGHAFPADFANLIHSRTEGSPLFMVELLRDLRERSVITEREGCWSLERPLPELLQELPGSIRSMIQRKLERLGDADRRLMAAASVQGAEFDSVAVAGALRLDPADVDDRLRLLDRVHGLVRAVREHEFPDRTLTLRYAFVHVLYQQALYDDLPATRKAALSAALARALESHHGSENLAVSPELACLYEVGRDFARAARHFWLSAQNAARVFAHREAIVLARRGLGQLAFLPETPQRAALELPLQTTLGLQLQVTEGYAAAEAKEAYSRARALCKPDTAPESLFPVLWGLWLISKVRSELLRAQEMADELLQLAHRVNDPTLALQAHQALGMTAFCRGQPAVALQHVGQATALYDPGRHVDNALQFGQDPAIISKAYGAVAFWLLGYPDQARRQSAAAITASRALSPSSQAVALHFAAMLYQFLKDAPRTREHAAAAGAIAAEHGFSFWLAGAGVLGGWGLAASGEIDEGTRQLRKGLADWSATGSVTYQTYYLGLLAEVLLAQGEREAATRAVEEALALVDQTGEGLFEAELYRLRGDLGIENTTAPEAVRRAEDDFHRALDISRRQDAKGLELRVATSMARRPFLSLSERRELLASTLDWFREGFDTLDLRHAREVLEQLT